MRLTNRGRIAGGMLATAVVLLGQHVVSAVAASRDASGAARHGAHAAAAAVAPSASLSGTASPSAASPSAASPASSPPPSAGAATSTLPPPGPMAMERSRDDLGPQPAAPPSPGPSSTAPAGSPSPTPSSAAGSPLGLGAAVRAGTGQLLTVPGRSSVAGKGPLRPYRVQVEAGIGEDGAAFAAAVQRTLTDARSWGSRLSFQRVDTGWAAFTVVLASPTLAERLCKPLEINYQLSCFSGGRSVVNDARWRGSAPSYGSDLASYRLYVVNHEVGHALGHKHEFCAGPGQLAPVMMQQTKGVGACRPNPWPFPPR